MGFRPGGSDVEPGQARLERGFRGIFYRLAEEHVQLLRLVDGVRAGRGDIAVQELVAHLRQRFGAYSAATQATFYPVLLGIDETRDVAQRLREDHAELEALLEHLAATELTDAWMTIFADATALLEQLIAQEVHLLFPLAQRVIDDDDAERLDADYQDARSRRKPD